METIKIKQNISVQQEVEKEVQVPSYWAYPPCFHWKVVSADFSVKVSNTHIGLGIDIDSAVQPFFHKGITECTKEEFDTAFAVAMEAIIKLNAEPIPA